MKYPFKKWPLKVALLTSVAFSNAIWAQSSNQGTGTQTQDEEDLEEIIVTGTRGSVVNSIQEKRNAQSVTDVLSADQAGRFPDFNLAESLARIPGVSFIRDNASGNGEFISIRGLDAQFVTTLRDGVRIGTADTARRTPLDIITGNGVSSIEVAKAPLPEHASEGLGGVVDIRTRGPLERRRDRVIIEGDIRENSFDSRNGFRVGGSWNKTFGKDFGFFVSGSFRRRFFTTNTVDGFSGFQLLNPLTLTGQDGTQVTFSDDDDDAEGGPLSFLPQNTIDIADAAFESFQYETNDIQRDNINISAVIDWRPSDSTILSIGGSLARTDEDETESTIQLDTDADDFIDDPLNPGNIIREFQDPEIDFGAIIRDEVEIQQRLFFRGETIVDNWTFNYIGSYARGFEDEPLLSIDFTNELEDAPGSPGTDAVSEQAITFAPFIFPDGPLFPVPNPLNAAVFDASQNPFCQNPDGGQNGNGACGEIADFDEELEDSRENERWSARFDAQYDFENHDFLKYFKFGVQYERSTFTDLDIDISLNDDSIAADGTFLGNDLPPNGLGENNASAQDFADNGINLFDAGVDDFSEVGSPFAGSPFNGVPITSRDTLLLLRNTFRDSFFAAQNDPSFAAGAALPADITTLDSTEEYFSGYFQLAAERGPWEFIGGLRVEYYEGDFSAPVDINIELDNGDDTLALSNLGADSQVENSADNFEFLPRFVVNYRPQDELIFRFAYSTAISRPDFTLLSGEIEADLNIELEEGVALADATIADIVAISSDLDVGNPNLDNAYSHAFDLSAEYYFDDQNAISFAAFYKNISNFIFTSFGADADLGLNNNAGTVDAVALFESQELTPEGETIINALGGFGVIAGSPLTDFIVNQSVNGNTAEVYGIELGIFHTFSYLPGFLSNVGFIGNLTLQQTSLPIDLAVLNADDALVQIGDADVGDVFTDDFELFNSPNLIYNAALFYDADGLEVNVSYRFIGTQLEEIEFFGFSQFQQGRGFLDASIEYQFENIPLTLFLRGNDLLDGGRRFSVLETLGDSRAASPDLATFNGRTVVAGARVRF